MLSYGSRSIIGVTVLVLWGVVGIGQVAWGAPQIKAVASFSILGDIVAQVGGDRVDVSTIVGPNEDSHVFHPTPQHVRQLAAADVVFVNGAGFEGWLDRLIAASGYDGEVIVTTAGMELLPIPSRHNSKADSHGGHEDHHEHAAESEHMDDHADEHHARADDHADDHHAHAHDHHEHGEFDPHAWQSLTYGRVYAQNVAAALVKVDPAGRADYTDRLETYLAEMDALNSEMRAQLAALPEQRRKVITAHAAFQYLTYEYGIEFLSIQGIGTAQAPSAAEVAALIDMVREEGISAIFGEVLVDNRLAQQIESETDASIGGTLYADALSELDGPASTYLDMIRYNVQQLIAALNS